MEILNKQQFLEAVKEDASLILQCDMRDKMIFFSRCSEPFTMDDYKDLCKQHIHDFEAHSALIDYLVQSSTEDTISAVTRRIASDNFIASKKGKMSYLSAPDIVPHKTGVPIERIDKALNIEIIEPCINEHPTIIQNTISKDEFLDTIRRYYLNGIIPYEDLKYIKFLTEEDIKYITRSPQGTLSVPISQDLIRRYKNRKPSVYQNHFIVNNKNCI